MIEIKKPPNTMDLRTLWNEAFGDGDKFLDTFFGTAFSDERCMALYFNNELASALYWFECELKGKKIAYIYAVATAKKFRGCGFCRQLMESTHKTLSVLGFSAAVLVPSSKELFNFYEKIGYKTCGYLGTIETQAAEATVPIKKIDKGEYARLRRDYLPDHAIIQEKENLDFLSSQADFFCGEDFLLAARIEKGRLYGLELLGNTKKAAQITAALTAENGYFRTVGGDIPFCMGIPLTYKPLDFPVHFAFAFD